MLKGVTPIVAAVLLLFLAVSIGGTTYMFISNVIEISEEETRRGLYTDLEMRQIICSRGAVEITVQNIGDANLENTEPDLLLYNRGENLVSERHSLDVADTGFIQAEELGTFTAYLQTPLNHTQQYTVELSFGSQSTVNGFCNVNTSYNNAAAVYKADEGQGDWLNDSTIHGHDAQLFDAANWTSAGQWGNATSFNGSAAVINTSSTDTLHLSDGFAITAWIHPNQTSGTHTIIEKDDAYRLRLTNGNVSFATHSSGSWHVVRGGAPDTETWSHVAATYNGTEADLYINDNHVNTSTIPDPEQSTAAVGIGGVTPSETNVFNGSIDELHLYDQGMR